MSEQRSQFADSPVSGQKNVRWVVAALILRGREVLMAMWKISDVWLEASATGTFERLGLTNELALAVNPRLVIVRVSTYGQFGQEEYLGRAGYDAIAQAFGGMMNLTGDPSGPPQRAKTYTGDFLTALTGWAATMMALWEVKKSGRGQVVVAAGRVAALGEADQRRPDRRGDDRPGNSGTELPGPGRHGRRVIFLRLAHLAGRRCSATTSE